MSDNQKPNQPIEAGLDRLERPDDGDFVAGLRAFVSWVKDLTKEE